MRHEWYNIIRKAAPEMHAVQVFEDFVAMAFHLMLGQREKALAVESLHQGGDSRKAEFARALILLGEAMKKNRFEDLLGEVHQEIRGGYSQQSTGSFYTPTSVCRCMASITVDHAAIRERLNRGEIITVNDPTIGAGRTLMALAELYPNDLAGFRFSGTDIELNACRMAYINMALNGMAARIIHGNELTLEHWDAWLTPEWKAYEDSRRWQLAFQYLRSMTASPAIPSTPKQLELNLSL